MTPWFRLKMQSLCCTAGVSVLELTDDEADVINGSHHEPSSLQEFAEQVLGGARDADCFWPSQAQQGVSS